MLKRWPIDYFKDGNGSHNFQLSTNGRIWVAWKPGQYNVQIISMAEQYIHCKVTQVTKMKGFFITFVYGANQEGQRRDLWEALKTIAKAMQEACCILGDFNSVLHPGDKMGGIDI